MTHDCPRMDNSGPVPKYNPSIPCAVCHANVKAKLQHFVAHLPALRAWLEDGASFDEKLSYELYEYFYHDMDYGTQTGDTGTFDEWIADRPDHIEDLIDRVEHFCLEAA